MNGDTKMVMDAIGDLRQEMNDRFDKVFTEIGKVEDVAHNHDKRIDEAKRIADEAKVAAGEARKENSDGLKALDKEGKKTRKIIGYGVLVILVSIVTLVGVAAGFPGVREYIRKLIMGG